MKSKDVIKDYRLLDCEDDLVGRVFNGKYGEFIVLGVTDKKQYSNKLYACKFLKTGFINLYRKQLILNRTILDPYYPNVYGVACIGIAKSSHFLYRIWSGIIRRCFDKNSKDYKHYGAKGVTVSEEWLCFENFIRDAQKVDGWNEEKVKLKELQLDKDKSGMKEYSLKGCTWIKKEENMKLANETQLNNQREFVAINIESGEQIITKGINKFAREYGANAGNICLCLQGRYKQSGGWTFEWLEEE